MKRQKDKEVEAKRSNKALVWVAISVGLATLLLSLIFLNSVLALLNTFITWLIPGRVFLPTSLDEVLMLLIALIMLVIAIISLLKDSKSDARWDARDARWDAREEATEKRHQEMMKYLIKQAERWEEQRKADQERWEQQRKEDQARWEATLKRWDEIDKQREKNRQADQERWEQQRKEDRRRRRYSR